MKASNLLKNLFVFTCAIIITGCANYYVEPQIGSLTDSRDGKVYTTAKYGDLEWMTQNLSYGSGDGIWIYDNSSTNQANYGLLYNWEAARTACPDGWRLPTFTEWRALVDMYGGVEVAGGAFKETGTSYWDSPNEGATNSSGLNIRGGGDYSLDYGFRSLKINGLYWSETEYSNDASLAESLVFSYAGTKAGYLADLKTNGKSIRCVKD